MVHLMDELNWGDSSADIGMHDGFCCVCSERLDEDNECWRCDITDPLNKKIGELELAVAALKMGNAWTPVSEGLPDKQSRILVIRENKLIYLVWHRGDGIFKRDGIVDDVDCVTHWKHLIGPLESDT